MFECPGAESQSTTVQGAYTGIGSHNPGGQKSEIKEDSYWSCEEESTPGLSPGYWWLLATLWCSLACDHISPMLPPSSPGLLPVSLRL